MGKKKYLHNHQEIIGGVLAECTILIPRIEALDVCTPDYLIREFEFMNEFMNVGIRPMTVIAEFMGDEEEWSPEMLQAAQIVADILGRISQKRKLHKSIFRLK